jgi:hypothetical protein
VPLHVLINIGNLEKAYITLDGTRVKFIIMIDWLGSASSFETF